MFLISLLSGTSNFLGSAQRASNVKPLAIANPKPTPETNLVAKSPNSPKNSLLVIAWTIFPPNSFRYFFLYINLSMFVTP
jgi:hypothetical protein